MKRPGPVLTEAGPGCGRTNAVTGIGGEMKKLMVLFALLPAVAGAAEDWWVKSDATLPSLVADGFQVVGFSVGEERPPMGPVTAYRYVLQKGPLTYLCTEKVMSANTVIARCYELRTPPSPSP
jgi:hypothetical protein